MSFIAIEGQHLHTHTHCLEICKKQTRHAMLMFCFLYPKKPLLLVLEAQEQPMTIYKFPNTMTEKNKLHCICKNIFKVNLTIS